MALNLVTSRDGEKRGAAPFTRIQKSEISCTKRIEKFSFAEYCDAFPSYSHGTTLCPSTRGIDHYSEIIR